MIFNVNDVKDIQWNLEAFDHLDIAPEKKEVVKTLIESHTQKAAIFDDFVPGKGRGLIFALHGKHSPTPMNLHIKGERRTTRCWQDPYCRGYQRGYDLLHLTDSRPH